MNFTQEMLSNSGDLFKDSCFLSKNKEDWSINIKCLQEHGIIQINDYFKNLGWILAISPFILIGIQYLFIHLATRQRETKKRLILYDIAKGCDMILYMLVVSIGIIFLYYFYNSRGILP